MVKTSAVAPQVLDLFQHVHGNKGFGVPGINDPNKLADDAARRTSKARPDKTRGHSIASNVDGAMAHHLDTFRARQFEKQTSAPAGVWKEDLDLDKRKTSSKPPTRTEWHGELLKQDEARKKGQPAYYTVTINKAFSLQFSWKDAKGKIGAFDKVKLQPDWDMTRAEFEAKFRHDLYWGNAMKSSNRDLTIATGRSMLRKFAEAKAKGSAFPLCDVHLLGGLMAKPLIRDVDDTTMRRLRHIERCVRREWPLLDHSQSPSLGVSILTNAGFDMTGKWVYWLVLQGN
ncbi:hypothetical protein F25303_7460 [Fusarium sp. NRRL 25303]|nr:hypothetical protein F25303_7460 [Fusarium sp. NRRL 25303]